MAAWERCERSGVPQMLSWPPDKKAGYPGAVVCIGCSFGVMAVAKSVWQGEDGHWYGKPRAHDVRKETPVVDSEMRYRT